MDLDNLINSMQQRLEEIPSNPLARGLCFGCKKDIIGKMMEAMNHHFHPACWKCSGCGIPLGVDGFYEENNKGWCQNCHQDKFLPKCDVCHNSIPDEYISVLGKKLHSSCLKCAKCGKLLNGKFYPQNNQTYCESCVD